MHVYIYVHIHIYMHMFGLHISGYIHIYVFRLTKRDCCRYLKDEFNSFIQVKSSKKRRDGYV